jgi:hypothetical protein
MMPAQAPALLLALLEDFLGSGPGGKGRRPGRATRSKGAHRT